MSNNKADKEEIIFAKRQAAKDKVKQELRIHTDKGMQIYRELEKDIVHRQERK